MSIPNAIGQLEAPLSAPKYGTLIPNRIFVGGIRHVYSSFNFDMQLLIIFYTQWRHNGVRTVPCILGVWKRKIDQNHRRPSGRQQRLRFCHIRNRTGSTATTKRGKFIRTGHINNIGFFCPNQLDQPN